jgi:hypothetical protein
MKNWEKITLGTIVGGALLGGAVYIVRLTRTSAQLETVPMVKVHKLDLTGLTLRVDVQLKNPTRTAFKIKFPFVKLVYKGTTVGSSQAVDKDIAIPAFGEAVVNQIMIRIPLLSMFSLSGGLIKAMQNNETTKIDVTIITTIDLGARKIPFTKIDTVTLTAAKE